MRAGVRNGSFAIYSRSPHEAAAIDIEFAELVTRSAGILIDRHKSTKTSR